MLWGRMIAGKAVRRRGPNRDNEGLQLLDDCVESVIMGVRP